MVSVPSVVQLRRRLRWTTPWFKTKEPKSVADGSVRRISYATPPDFMGNVVGDLSARRGIIQGMEDVVGVKVIRAEVPLAEMFGYSTALRSATQGRATYTMEFKHYAEAPKNIADGIIDRDNPDKNPRRKK